jgi:hypothetical protein
MKGDNMLSWKRTFSIGLILIMLASALIVFSGAEADPTRASNPTLTSASVTPYTGYNDTLFNFTVVYTDVDGDAPISMFLVIDNVPLNMTEIGGPNSSYSRGVGFFHTTYLSAGTHNYYFITQNVLRELGISPQVGTFNISVQTRSAGPQLYNSTYNPARPDDTTGVNFTVMYKHPNGTAPMYVNLIIQKGGLNQTYNMTRSGSNYTAGVTFTKFLQLTSGYYNYLFTARVDQTSAVNLPPSSMYTLFVASSGPQNNAPVLGGPAVSPRNPSSGQNTTFWVKYTDIDNDAPMGVWLTIYPQTDDRNDTIVNMTVGSGNYTVGVNCTATINAPENGTYYYYFTTKDINGAQATTSTYYFVVGSGNPPQPRNPYLTYGMHSPKSPTVNDTINFTVTYTDPLGLRTPHYVQIYLTNLDVEVLVPTVYNMTKGGGDLLNGTTYYYPVSLMAGNYSYYFHAIVGNYSTSYPYGYFLNLTVTNGSTPPPPINTAPILSSGSHTPIRPTSRSNVTFSVTYTDRDSDPPTYIKLHINSIVSSRPYSVYNMTWTGNSYIYGVRAQYVLALTTGNYSYYFTTSSNVHNVSLPSNSQFFILSVIPATPPPPPQDRAPTLSGAGMYPLSPTANQTIYFSIVYTDADNDAPTSVNLHILAAGAPNYFNYSMNVPRGTYSNGVPCTHSPSLTTGSYFYFFSATSTNFTVTYPSTGSLSFNVSSGPSQPPPNRTNVGARAKIVHTDDGATIEVTEKEEGFTISLSDSGKDFIEIEVSSVSGEDRVIEMLMDPDMFDIDSPDDIAVKVDGKEIPYTWVADPEEWSGEEPAYYIRYTEEGAVLYILLPDAENHTITANIPDEPDSRTNLWYYFIAIFIVIVIAAAVAISLLTSMQKKKIKEYYDDFDTGVRDERIASGKLIDEDDIDWDDLVEAE